jgi:hypothetical protein
MDDGTLLALNICANIVKIQEQIHVTSSDFVRSPQNVQSILKIRFCKQFIKLNSVYVC